MKIVIVSGSSGQHAAVVYKAAILAGLDVAGFVTIDPDARPTVLDCPYLGGPDMLRDPVLLRGAAFVPACGSNADRRSVAEAILNSREYQDAHPSSAQFVEGLYEDVLGRQPHASESAVWRADLASGGSRREAVADFVNSAEAVDQVIEGYYAQFLDHLPDSTAANPWADMLKPGGSATSVAIGILSSPEYVQKSTRA